jgi:mannose-6-phosphate isomerase-like protein (cupin superfamily)
MNRVFEARGFITVPDGTEVSAFLNATDSAQPDVPWGVLGEMSIAAGRIAPRQHSWVHVHWLVTVVTYVVAGQLRVRMKSVAAEPYDCRLLQGQAVVVEPGTLFQLRNDTDDRVEVLYIVSPTYVFEMQGDTVAYDEATLVASSWEELAASGYDLTRLEPARREARARRDEAKRRLEQRKNSPR